MAEREPEEEGRKGGSAEYHMPAQYAREHATDVVTRISRVQWGPVFAGYAIAVATALLLFALGMAIGLRPAGLMFWAAGFACVGAFIGGIIAARTARVGVGRAVLHGAIVWALFMFTDVLTFGGAVRGTVLSAVGMAGTTPANAVMATTTAVRAVGWWFFGTYTCLLAAAILGALAGAAPPEAETEQR